MILSLFVTELDCLLARPIGQTAQSALLQEVARGAIIEKYADLEIGLADASIVVLAERHGVAEVLTLDQRRFRSLSTISTSSAQSVMSPSSGQGE